MDNLNVLGTSNRVTLRWVPGHSGIDGNEKADALARRGAETPDCGPEPFCGIAKQHAYSILKIHCNRQALQEWQSTSGQIHSKALIKGYRKKFTKELLQLNKYKTSAVTRILTGHCKLNKHMFTLGLSQTAMCRLCHETEETAMHILCSCGPLMHRRSIYLGQHIMQPEEIQMLPAQKIWKFLESTGLSGEL
ncbi:unnamed protein product, partial [Brenthis ino]